MNELHLFAGAGGGILAGQLQGNRCVCAVEFDPYAQAVLVARQNDGTFPPFPIWDDVRTFDGRPWRGIVDIVAGGFPCQDVSAAGTGDGLDGERSGLWTEMARIIREVQPLGVEVENSPMLTSRGLGRVLGDLAAMGFDAEWGIVSAADTEAPHLRERIWVVAHANGNRYEGAPSRETTTRTNDGKQPRSEALRRTCSTWPSWPNEPRVGRVAYGMAHRAHRIKALGNGQVPRVAATAFTLLSR
ncbi:DNA cytosine methyltransferase [Burkholderia sp. AU15512]|uniref:DNA cytosine methyltransferase n=1 Tax=Burkholderia sp. AU15512 TaxID=2015345 RepID=UPI000B7A23B2|nr:DNA cytosine methyltransferase [Burkholderia sp. AU15512]